MENGANTDGDLPIANAPEDDNIKGITNINRKIEDTEIPEFVEIIEELKEKGKFIYTYEKRTSNLVYIDKKSNTINYVFDGYGKNLEFTTRFDLIVDEEINKYVKSIDTVRIVNKSVVKIKIDKNKIKKDIMRFLLKYGEDEFDIGIITNSCVYYNDVFITKTDYEKNVFITKNFEKIEETLDYIVPEENEYIKIFHILQKLLENNFYKCCAFIINAMLGDAEGNKPILFITGSTRVGKTSTARLIEAVVEGKKRVISPLELEKILPEVLGARIAIFDDVSTKEKKTEFFDILKRICTNEKIVINQRYTKSGVLLSCNCFFICTSTNDNLFSFDKQQENRIIKVNISKIDYAKENMDRILRDVELIKKMRGAFYRLMPAVLTNMYLIKEKDIKKRYTQYMKVLYAIEKIFPPVDGNSEFVEVNCEESEIEIDEEVKVFLEFIIDIKEIENTPEEIFAIFTDWVLKNKSGKPVVEKILNIRAINNFFRKIYAIAEHDEINYKEWIIEYKKKCVKKKKEDGKWTTIKPLKLKAYVKE